MIVAADADTPLQAMSLLASPTGHFTRVVNSGETTASVQIEGIDDSGTRHCPVTLTVAAGATAPFNSGDLEDGNADKGLASGIGSGTGDWRLELTTSDDIQVLSYIRTPDGFVTSMHDTLRGESDELGDHSCEVAIFNPGSNTNQVSSLRMINHGSTAAQLAIAGADDGSALPGPAPVTLTLAAGQARRTITFQQLESGDGVTGALGDGAGKCWLLVRSDRPIEVMNIASGRPTGWSRSRRTPALAAPGGLPGAESEAGRASILLLVQASLTLPHDIRVMQLREVLPLVAPDRARRVGEVHLLVVLVRAPDPVRLARPGRGGRPVRQRAGPSRRRRDGPSLRDSRGGPERTRAPTWRRQQTSY